MCIVFKQCDIKKKIIFTLTRDHSQIILSASLWHHRECSLKPNNEDTNVSIDNKTSLQMNWFKTSLGRW